MKRKHRDLVCRLIREELRENPYARPFTIYRKYGLKRRRVEFHFTYHITAEEIIDLWKQRKQEEPQITSEENTNFAYIAGLIDGEGHFCIKKALSKTSRTGWYPMIYMVVSNVHYPTLKWAQSIIGGNLLKRKLKNRNYPYIYNLHLSSKQLRKVILKILPFLKIKKTHGELIAEALGYCRPGRRPNPFLGRLLEIREELHKLNPRQVKQKYKKDEFPTKFIARNISSV